MRAKNNDVHEQSNSDLLNEETTPKQWALLHSLEQQHAALVKHTSQLTELSDTAAHMMSQGSLDTLPQFIAEEIVRLTNASGAYIHMVHETGDYLQVVAACGELAEQLMDATRERGSGLSAKAWETGRVQCTDNYNQEWSNVVVMQQDIKAVAVPLIFSGRTTGVAFVTASIADDLYSQIPLLREIAKVASLSIFYTEQLEAKAHELQRIKALTELGEVLYQTTDWSAVLDSIFQHLFDIFDVERVTLYQMSNAGGKQFTQYTRRKSNDKITILPPEHQTLRDNSISNWCYKNQIFAQINRHVEDQRESSDVHEHRRFKEIGSTMCIPVSHDDEPWGVCKISKHINKRNFDESEASAFQAVASQVSTALQRNTLLAKVRYQAHHDSLTGLPNRLSFQEYFLSQVEKTNNGKYAVLFCDLDGFKAVNDSYGHDIGDKVIKKCAARINDCIRDSDYLARMGGDEFAVMLNLEETEYDIDILARRILSTISKTIHTKELRINIGISIGISLYPQDGTAFSALLNYAEVAMYVAKHSKKGKIRYFNKKDSEEIRKKNNLRSALRVALEKNEFELWYQPQVCWPTGRVCGVEALIRWNHPERGMVSPFEFIPIAEESGLIDPLGLWIMDKAISNLKSWNMPKHLNFSMAVNIAPPQFIDANFSKKVLAILNKHKVDPKLLKIEITEGFIMHDRETVVMHLNQLREKGVTVAIDDFGTGYSSLSYLQDLPIDILKVDRAFVRSMTAENYEKSIASSIIVLAKSLGFSTITEGVETKEQLDLIVELGSEIIQGYYYSKPVREAELLGTICDIEKYINTQQKIA